VVSFLLSVTFACGVIIATAHVVNRRFIAPIYDVAANLTAFGCAVAASVLLGHWIPALLSAGALLCWLALARRTMLARRSDVPSRQEIRAERRLLDQPVPSSADPAQHGARRPERNNAAP